MDWGLIGASTIASEHVIGAGRGADYAARHRIYEGF